MLVARSLVLVLLLAILATGQASGATTSMGGTDVLTPVVHPAFCPADCTPNVGIKYDYRNNLDVNVTATVWWVVHNSLGQTVAIGSGLALFPAGSNRTGYVVRPLPLGSYNSTVFATTDGGVAISREAYVAFTRT